jgi:hypothetical protein
MLFLIYILLIHTLLSNGVYQLYTSKKQHKRTQFYLFLLYQILTLYDYKKHLRY